MAETLRELVVSLSLQSDSFSKNIKSLQGQIQEAESRFQAAGAGVDDFAHKTDGLKAKAGMLTDKLRIQGQVTQQYERALNRATATLQKNVQKQQDLSSKLTTAKTRYATLKPQIDKTKAAYDASVKATGDNSEESNRLGVELLDLEAQYKATGDEIKTLEGQIEANSKTLQRNADTVTKLQSSLNKAKSAEAATASELSKTSKAIETNKAKWDAAAKSLDTFGNSATNAGKSISKVGGNSPPTSPRRCLLWARLRRRAQQNLKQRSQGCARLWTRPRRNLQRWMKHYKT